MRVPVLAALVVPVLLVSGAVAVYSTSRPVKAEVRTYYIAADEVTADLASAGDPATRYVNARYREYTDATFTHAKPRPAGWEHLAFLGPLIRANVGDTVRIVFRNRVGFPVNVHPDAVLGHGRAEAARATLSAAPSASSAALGADDDAPVPPGGTRTYTWPVPTEAGPGVDDHGSVLWLYHSHTGQPTSDEAGLIGPIIIYKRGALR